MECCFRCYWDCIDWWRRARFGSRSITTVVRKRHLRKSSSEKLLDIRSLLLRIDPNHPVSKYYRTLRLLGEGAFGKVYEVQHRETGGIRALKEIASSSLEDVEYVQTELEVMLRLDHPNIVKLYEYFEDACSLHLITELCRGGDFGELQQQYQRRALAVSEVRLLFRDVLLALAYCHDQHVVHRDMKFENCLVDIQPQRWVAKVIDFGLAAIRSHGEDNTWMSEQLGTRYWIAPEIINKNVKYGVECDMWAFGVMIYIFLTDEHPCARDAFQLPNDVLFHKILRDQVRTSPLTQISATPDLRDLLAGLLNKNPDQRMTAAQALNHPWFSVGELRLSRREPSMPETSSLSQVVARAKTFGQATRFEKAVLTLVSYRHQTHEIEQLRKAFMQMDTAGNGTLSKEELAAGIQACGVAMSPEEVDQMFEALDADGTGKVHFTEFLAGTIQPSEFISDKAVKEVFNFFDIDRTGKVSYSELCHVLGDEAAAYSVLQAGDLARDGCLSYDEFKRLMCDAATRVTLRHSQSSTL